MEDHRFLLCTKNSKCFSVCPCDKRFRLRAPSQRSPGIRQMSCFPITQQNEHSTPRGSFFSPTIPAPDGKCGATAQRGSSWAMGSKVTETAEVRLGPASCWDTWVQAPRFPEPLRATRPVRHYSHCPPWTADSNRGGTASGFWDGTPGQARAPGITGILGKRQPLGLRWLQILQKTRMNMFFFPKNEAQFNVIDNHFLSCPASNLNHLPFLYWHLDFRLQRRDPGLTSRMVFIKGACVRRDEGRVQSSDSVFSGWRGRKEYQETVWPRGEKRIWN